MKTLDRSLILYTMLVKVDFGALHEVLDGVRRLRYRRDTTLRVCPTHSKRLQWVSTW